MALFRMKRVNEQVRRVLSDLIRKRLPVEDHGLVSVTEVEVAKDLKTANVYISTVGVSMPAGQGIIETLEKIRPDLQRELSRSVVLKYTPRLCFKEDNSLEHGQHVVDLLDTLDQDKRLE